MSKRKALGTNPLEIEVNVCDHAVIRDMIRGKKFSKVAEDDAPAVQDARPARKAATPKKPKAAVAKPRPVIVAETQPVEPMLEPAVVAETPAPVETAPEPVVVSAPEPAETMCEEHIEKSGGIFRKTISFLSRRLKIAG